MCSELCLPEVSFHQTIPKHTFTFKFYQTRARLLFEWKLCLILRKFDVSQEFKVKHNGRRPIEFTLKLLSL